MKLTKSKVSQTLNTESLFKKELSSKAKKLFGEKLIEKMNIRTVSGEDYRGGSFQKYSKDYALKKGVSRSAVDMVLNQKMLPSIKSKNVDSDLGDLELAVSKKESIKAYAHMTGFKGHKFIKNTAPRLFFGFKQKDLKKIVTEVKKEIPEEFKRAKKDDKLNVQDIREGMVSENQKKINEVAKEFSDIFGDL